MTAPSAARLQQRIDALCGASLRALAGQADLHLRGGRLYRGQRLLVIAAPHLYPEPGSAWAGHRGAADGLALRQVHSDAALHAAHRPADAVARAVFDLLEQLRVESLVAPTWPGVRHNLRARFEDWSAAFAAASLIETRSGLLLFALAQTVRSRLSGEPVFEPMEDAIETSRGRLAQAAGHELAALKRQRAVQALFIPPALVLAARVAGLLAALRAEAADAADITDAADATEDARNGARFTLLIDWGPDADEDSALPHAGLGHSRLLADAPGGYRVYQRDHDQQHDAARLARADELRSLRDTLDGHLARSGLNIGRLARALQQLLAQPRPDDWDSGQDQGRIDGRRLAQLVASPAERRLFRTEHLLPQPRCQLTLLIDCSGSMKQHSTWVAVLADVLARALCQAGVRCEVLGYTTAAWHGGRPARAWQRAGRPPHPGRLNELRHLVFKDARHTWRRARPGLAALLKADLFREGIDGEAVAWACQRLRAASVADDGQPIERRLLLVLSDGRPMDSATHAANGPHYLDHHLRQVVDTETARGDIEILGLGVGLDLRACYPRCLALDPAQALSQTSLGEVIALIAGRRPR